MEENYQLNLKFQNALGKIEAVCFFIPLYLTDILSFFCLCFSWTCFISNVNVESYSLEAL
jgi:hypothetical protein